MTNVASIAAVMSAALLLLSPPALSQSPTGSGPGSGAGTGNPPTTNPGQARPGGTVESTTPPGNELPAASSGGRTVGQAGRTSVIEQKTDSRVEETEREVSRRIKSICKGC